MGLPEVSSQRSVGMGCQHGRGNPPLPSPASPNTRPPNGPGWRCRPPGPGGDDAEEGDEPDDSDEWDLDIDEKEMMAELEEMRKEDYKVKRDNSGWPGGRNGCVCRQLFGTSALVRLPRPC